jgi:hypothetical protein
MFISSQQTASIFGRRQYRKNKGLHVLADHGTNHAS